MNDTEVRYFDGLEVREEGETPKITGTAIRYGDKYSLGSVDETILPGALKPLKRGLGLNLMHDSKRLIARTGAGLEVRFKDDGIEVEADVPDTRDGQDALTMGQGRLAEGSITGV